jgi:sugar lactone lactonase YvrE
MKKAKNSLVLFITGSFFLLVSCGKNESTDTSITISSISPDMGKAGTLVTLSGIGFSTTLTANIVTLNGKSCPVTNATPTQLAITIPAAAGSGNIIVAVGNKSAQSTLFTFVPTSITSIAPISGPKGTTVTITGTGFSTTATDNKVTLNDKVCTVTNSTSTQLTVTIPPSAGSGNLQVAIDGNTVQSTQFTFIYTVTVSTLAGSTPGYQDETGVNAKFNDPSGVIVDASANLYVTDFGNEKIRKISPIGLVTTLAGSTAGFVNGTGINAQFSGPARIAVDNQGNVFVADYDNNKIRKITPGGVVTTLAGSNAGYTDANGTSAQFNGPVGVAVDAAGNVYVAERFNNKIRKITPVGDVTTLAGSTGGYADAAGIAAKFSSPFGLTIDATGNLYVSDTGNQKIRKITPAGVVTTVAGSTQGYLDSSISTTAQFNNPSDLAVDGAGNIYVSDFDNHKIRKISTAGEVTTLAGSTPGYADGTGTTAQFNRPSDVAVDAAGNLFVSESLNHKIRKITLD